MATLRSYPLEEETRSREEAEDHKVELANARIELAQMRYRRMVERGLRWAIFPMNKKKQGPIGHVRPR